MKIYTLALIAFLLLTPSVYAFSTSIEVTTEPGKYVMIRIFEANNRLNLLQSVFDRRVDFENKIMIAHASDYSRLDIEVYIKDQPNGDTRHYKRYEGVSAGTPFTVTLPEDAGSTQDAPPLNDTNQTNPGNVTNSTNMTAPEVSPGITGNAVAETPLLQKIKWYYIVAGALIAVIIVAGGLTIKDRRSKKAPAAAPKSPPGSAKDPNELESKLRDTEKRLEQATREIMRIKNEEQIKEIQKRIDAEQEQIRRLRQGFP